MDLPTFAGLEYQGKKRKTRRELFLERMDGLIPWHSLQERIRPHYCQRRRSFDPGSLLLSSENVRVSAQGKCPLVWC